MYQVASSLHLNKHDNEDERVTEMKRLIDLNSQNKGCSHVCTTKYRVLHIWNLKRARTGSLATIH